jgi:hypothetical protein
LIGLRHRLRTATAWRGINIFIRDRFDYMLADVASPLSAFPASASKDLQTMDEAAAEGKTDDNSRWLKPDGTHRSSDRFDREVYYWAEVEGDPDPAYL